MPSDALVQAALAAAGRPREAYRSAVVTALEELRRALGSHFDSDDDRSAGLARTLGPFAAGRIDSGRLAAVLARDDTLSPAAVQVMERAVEVLAERVAQDEDLFRVVVEPGGDLRDAVRDALADLGRAFGAARAAELARTGRYVPDEHHDLLESFPFRRWSAAERRVAPALVVEVEGADLRPAGLADFLDGAQALVLVVRGKAPPAALARAIAPGVLVVQTTSVDELEQALAWEGPALAALFEDGTGVVPFVHDPRAGTLPWERIHLQDTTEALRERFTDRGRRGQDLEHLLALATAPAAEAPGTAPEEEAEPTTGVDRLAAWLLAQTDLGED